MSIVQEVGSFALNTSTGLQTVNLSIDPKIVIFLGTVPTANGVSDNMLMSFGAGISSSSRFCGGVTDEDNVDPTDVSKVTRNVRICDMLFPGSTSADYQIDLDSLGTGKFIIDIENKPDVASRMGFWAIGGDDLTDVTIIDFVGNGSSGDQIVTGLPAKPDALLFFNTNQDVQSGDVNDAVFSLGMAISPTERAYITNSMKNNRLGPIKALTTRNQGTDRCIQLVEDDGVEVDKADLKSMNSNGFTITWDNGNTERFRCIAFTGGQYKIKTFTARTSTGNFSETGVGFKAGGGLFASWARVASAAQQDNAWMSLGVVTDTDKRFILGGNSEHDIIPSNSRQWTDDTKLYQAYNLSGGLRGAIDFVSWNSDGYTLNQTKEETTLVQIIAFLIGDAAAPAGNLLLSHPPRMEYGL